MNWLSRTSRALRDGKLTRRAAALGAEAWIELLTVQWALRRRPLPDVLARLDRIPAAKPLTAGRWRIGGPVPATPQELSTAVQRAAHYLPVPTLCLPQSIALAKMMALRGDSCEVIIGALPQNGSLDAHAWVEYEGSPLNSPPDSADKHPVLIRHAVQRLQRSKR